MRDENLPRPRLDERTILRAKAHADHERRSLSQMISILVDEALAARYKSGLERAVPPHALAKLSRVA
jgi:hypothetical protein